MVTKIAHLSDLHCNSNSKWQSKFDNIKSLLIAEQPNIIIITGDLVNNPRKKHFDKIAYEIKELQDKLGEDTYFVPVPGNHDYYIYGNRLFDILCLRLFKKEKKYSNFERQFNFPDSTDKILESILVKYGIAIFSFDSNASGFFSFFAEGRVNDPIKTVNSRIEFYKKICADKDVDFKDVKKIAALHHHPLPIATSTHEEPIENLLVLRNSYEFIQACRLAQIDIILHGHKHVTNLMEYDFLAEDSKPIIISSCGCSAHYSTDVNEVKIIEIADSGTVGIQCYRSSKHQDLLKLDQDLGEIVYYGDIRKKKSENFNYYNKRISTVAQVKNKTKIVSLGSDGAAFITISCSDITWKEGLPRGDRSITERFRSDLGRIAGGQYEFTHCPLTGETPSEWINPKIENHIIPNPDQSEAFEIDFKPLSAYADSNKDCLILNYRLASGYALTLREHKERYKDWPENEPRVECASASVDYPTYLLELIVMFPDADFFPAVAGVSAKAVLEEDLSSGEGMGLLYNTLDINDEESDFIIKKGAIRIRPEVGQMSLIVKYPQPGIEYSLRWTLPERDRREIDNYQSIYSNNIRICEYFIEKKHPETVDDIYAKFCEHLDEFLENNSVKLFLLIYDPNECKLVVIRCPEDFEDRINGGMLPGRGPAGTAFKLRRIIFWERGTACLPQDTASQPINLPDLPVEGVLKDFKPVKVLAIPLLFPSTISKNGGMAGGDDKYIGPVWGCLSLASEQESSFSSLAGIAPKEKEEKLREIFCQVNLFQKDLITEKLSGYNLN